MDETLLTIPDAVVKTGLLPAELYREVTAGRLAPSAESPVKFTPEAVDAWLDGRNGALRELAGHAGIDMPAGDASLPAAAASVAGMLGKTAVDGTAALRVENGTVVLTTETGRIELGAEAGRLFTDDVRTRAGAAPGMPGTGVFALPDTDPAVQVKARILPGTDGTVMALSFRTGVRTVRWEDTGCTADQAAALARGLQVPGGIVLLADPDGTVFESAADALAGAPGGCLPLVTVERRAHFNRPGTVRLKVDPADEAKSFPALVRHAAAAGATVLAEGVTSADDARTVLEAAAAGTRMVVCAAAADTADLLGRWLASGVSKELTARYLGALAAWVRVPAACASCGTDHSLSADEAARFGLDAGTAVKDNAGCPACGGTVLADVWAHADAAVLARTADPANPDALRAAARSVGTGLVLTTADALREGRVPLQAAAVLVAPA